MALAGGASAGDLTSASYRVRGLHPASIGPARTTSTSSIPHFSGSGVSLGQGDALGPAGSAVNLTTSWPGFWPIAAGALPALDLDGDGRQSFLDLDGDGDGLLDVVETGTGVTITAPSHSVWAFLGWSGACTGTGSCIVTMDANKSVTATYGPG